MNVELLEITPDAEKHIEQAGRTCYQSHDNTREDSEKTFIEKIIKNGHHSVLEHGYASFRINGVSRSLTHQLVRHRLMAISQQSQRYCNEENFAYVTPDAIKDNPQAQKLFDEFMAVAKESYCKLQQAGLKNEDARYVLPNAVCSEIVISANFRQLRHIFALRCSPKAQLEIRKCALSMLRIMKHHVPAVFGDFVIDSEKRTAGSPFAY
ncbi:MAG: thymidylate synthase (FAD) [Planctomycetales bacterium 4572_13]|nr:MAG: thymidylate synthase (FAD) [Planctomycetales bacterium 4572_13]